MRLRRIALDQVRQFDRPVEVSDLRPGLNLLAGPNELGKSTLLDALRAALFIPHGSKKAGTLQHFTHQTAPRVVLELEIEGALWRLEKRFLISPRAWLEGPHGRFESKAAEEELAKLLGGEAEPAQGLWNLLLVTQGQALAPGVPGDARAVLQASLEAALGGEAGGQSAKALIARLDEQLGDLVHRGHGAPIKQYAEVLQRTKELDRKIEALMLRREENRADLDALEDVIARRDELRAGADPASLRDLEARLANAHRHQALHHALVQAEAAREAARRDLERRRQQIARRAALEDELRAARQVEADARRVLAEAESDGREIRARHDALLARRDQLRALGTDLESWRRLDRTLGAEASEVAFDLRPGAQARVRLGGERPAASRFAVRVRDRLRIEIDAVGTFEVRPAPDRTAPLQRELAGIASRIESGRAALGLAQDEAIEPHLAEVEAACTESEARLLAARERFGEVRAGLQAAETDARARARAREQQDADLEAARQDLPDAILTERLEAHEREVAAATDARAQAPLETEGDVAGLEARLAQFREVADQQATLERQALELRTRIETRAADGLNEDIGELEAERRALVARREAMAREVAVLRLLKATLKEAEEAVRERYLEPLIARLQPHLEAVLPGARASLDDDLQVTLVQRDRVCEPFASLSHGTREQIAIVARLAFAEVLADQGRPAVVVLDDALAFSDDARLERMFRVLERAAARVQILVLTCRARAFDGLVANRVRLVEDAAGAGEAAA